MANTRGSFSYATGVNRFISRIPSRFRDALAAQTASGEVAEASTAQLLGLQAQASRDQTASEVEALNAKAASAATAKEARGFRSDAAAAGDRAAGDQAEADAYGIAAGFADVGAGLEMDAAGIRAYQEDQTAMKTIGSQRASVAGSGFAEAGTSLAMYHASVREAAVGQALIGLQGNIDASGYMAQAAASRSAADVSLMSRDAWLNASGRAEEAAAAAEADTSARDAALALSQQYADASALGLARSAELLAETTVPDNGFGPKSNDPGWTSGRMTSADLFSKQRAF